MKFKLLILFSLIFNNISCLIPRCNIVPQNINYFVKNKQSSIINNYRNSKKFGDSKLCYVNKTYLFISTPTYSKYEYRKYSVDLNSDDGLLLFDQHSSKNTNPERYGLVEREGVLHNLNDGISHTDPYLVHSQSFNRPDYSRPVSGTITKELLQKLTPTYDKDYNRVLKAKPVSLEQSKSSIHKLLAKIDVKDTIDRARINARKFKRLMRNFIYPKGASKEVIKFTNLKILERILLSLSSSIALNIKPFTLPDTTDPNKGLSGFLKSRLSGTKMTTMFLTSVFKDVFSRVLSYYWFNKSKNVAEHPKLYRLVSTMGHSVFSLWDFFINLFAIEPKPILLAFSNVVKQMFIVTHNVLNQEYYNEANEHKNLSKEDDNYSDVEPLSENEDPEKVLEELEKVFSEVEDEYEDGRKYHSDYESSSDSESDTDSDTDLSSDDDRDNYVDSDPNERDVEPDFEDSEIRRLLGPEFSKISKDSVSDKQTSSQSLIIDGLEKSITNSNSIRNVNNNNVTNDDKVNNHGNDNKHKEDQETVNNEPKQSNFFSNKILDQLEKQYELAMDPSLLKTDVDYLNHLKVIQNMKQNQKDKEKDEENVNQNKTNNQTISNETNANQNRNLNHNTVNNANLNQTLNENLNHTTANNLKYSQTQLLKDNIKYKEYNTNKNSTLVPYKDESAFVFDLVGMSIGMFVSYLLNKYNSNAFKIATILSNFAANNLLTAYMTTLVDKYQ